MKDNFDHRCFCGDYKAGIILVGILKEHDKKMLRKVSNVIQIFYSRAKALENIDYHYEFYLKHAFSETKKSIVEYKYPKSIETHLLNVISAIYRDKLKKKIVNESKN